MGSFVQALAQTPELRQAMVELSRDKGTGMLVKCEPTRVLRQVRNLFVGPLLMHGDIILDHPEEFIAATREEFGDLSPLYVLSAVANALLPLNPDTDLSRRRAERSIKLLPLFGVDDSSLQQFLGGSHWEFQARLAMVGNISYALDEAFSKIVSIVRNAITRGKAKEKHPDALKVLLAATSIYLAISLKNRPIGAISEFRAEQAKKLVADLAGHFGPNFERLDEVGRTYFLHLQRLGSVMACAIDSRYVIGRAELVSRLFIERKWAASATALVVAALASLLHSLAVWPVLIGGSHVDQHMKQSLKWLLKAVEPGSFPTVETFCIAVQAADSDPEKYRNADAWTSILLEIDDAVSSMPRVPPALKSQKQGESLN